MSFGLGICHSFFLYNLFSPDDSAISSLQLDRSCCRLVLFSSFFEYASQFILSSMFLSFCIEQVVLVMCSEQRSELQMGSCNGQ